MIPLYPELIRLHDNVHIARNVHFETHDNINSMINFVYLDRQQMKSIAGMYGELSRGGIPSDIGTEVPYTKLPEYVGCIEIMDNVFVGSDTTIMYGVKIGENCIIGSGSLVNKDCEPNSIYAGVPARKVGNFDDFVEKRRKMDYSYVKRNQHISAEEVEAAWRMFEERHTGV